ncbi:hypothetical protein [Agromyces subbeticus]|uniref:hypothetical protein n=1 Tax=Agromyces subbeticus TaxID=293890 RepID=UPI0003B57E27|nr:hypothetical protein [Agromyces subbeticus]
MNVRAGRGEALSPDDDFTVAQDTEFDEADAAGEAADDERPLDDALTDETPGIDEERRVDLADEREAAGEE